MLLIDENDTPYFFDEKGATSFYFLYKNASSPVLMLPFHSYVSDLLKSTKIPLYSKLTELFAEKTRKKEDREGKSLPYYFGSPRRIYLESNPTGY